MYGHMLGKVLELSNGTSQALKLGLVQLQQLQATSSSECWNPSTKVHGIASQKTAISE
jgi:hypothetical protein